MIYSEIKNLVDEDIAILVSFDNHPYQYLCECGQASKLSVKEIQQCKAIFISHTHIDHFINFDSVLRHQIGTQNHVVIAGPPELAKQVQAKLKAYTWNLVSADAIHYEVREVHENHRIKRYRLLPPFWELEALSEEIGTPLYETDKFEVAAVLLDHKTPSMAYKFKEKDSVQIHLEKSEFRGGPWIKTLKEAFVANLPNTPIQVNGRSYKAFELYNLLTIKEGMSLGVIMDHASSAANHRKIAEVFTGTTKVYIESFYLEQDRDLAEKNYHSYTKASASIMNTCGIHTAIPVHFSRKYNATEITALKNEFQQYLQQKTP